MMRKARKIIKRIETEDGYFEKAKGMHWKTYDRLVKQECNISYYVDRSINRLLSNCRQTKTPSAPREAGALGVLFMFLILGTIAL